MTVVGECHIGPNEHVIFDGQPVPHLNAAFDRDAIADDGLALDEAMGADIAVFSDFRAAKDDNKLPNSGAFAGSCLAVGQGVNLRRHRDDHSTRGRISDSTFSGTC